MIKVYFVRHGQTKYNVLQEHQPESAGLSKLGIKQAKILAKRFSKISIDIIYSSPMKRAKQTAEIINKSLKKKIVYSDFLKERKGPSEFLGKRTDSTEVLKINKIRNLHEKDPFWHYSDEENFIEYKERIKKFFNPRTDASLIEEAMVGAVVSNPIARNTTFLSGCAAASFTASRAE